QSKKKRVTVYDLLQNSKVEVEQNIGGVERPVLGEFELSGVTVNYFLRSIDAVTMALDHRLRLLSLEFTESPVAVSKTPGDCPKWLQNAMRGYWKLACRPPKPSSSKAPSITPSVSHGIRHRAHTASNNSMVGGGSIMPWSTSTTSQISDHHLETAEFMTSGKRSRPLLSYSSEARMAATVASAPPLLPPQVSFMPTSESIDGGRLPSAQTSIYKAGTSHMSPSKPATGKQLSMSAAICTTVQPAASDDLSTLPLLEALLSDSANVLVPPFPLHNPAAASRSGIKRPLDAEPGTTGYVAGGPPGGGGGGDAAVMMAAAASVSAGNKRVRHSADSAIIPPTDPYGYGGFNYQQGYADAGSGVYQQQQQLQAGAKEGESFNNAIARLTSDMGLDSASTRAFAASLSNQLMPPPASPSSAHMDNAHATSVFAASGMQQQHSQAPSATHRYSQLQQQQFQQQQQYQAHIRRT
ncbi:hypothetical protein GGF44_005192, partial [Coemansia sp. RSA 1694]